MGEVDSLLGQLEEAETEADLQETLTYLEEANPTEEERSELAYGLATAYFRLEEHEEVARWLNKTDDDRRFQLLGFNLIKMERHQDAARAFERAGEVIPGERQECRLLRAQALALGGDHEAGREILEDLLEADIPADFRSECLLNRGTLEVERGQPDAAREYFEQIIEAEDSEQFMSEAAYHLVQIEGDAGRLDSAIEYARWLKSNGAAQHWKQAGRDALRDLQQQKRDRQNKLRDYEY